jgi:hypothetical protein
MKKCFHSASDCCFILSRDQSTPGDSLLFFALSVGLIEKFLCFLCRVVSLALGVGLTERLSLFSLQGCLPGSRCWTNRETFLVFFVRLSPWLSVLD